MSFSFRTQREDIVAQRRSAEQRLRVIERRPFSGDIHPIPKSELLALLHLVPIEMLHGLRLIELRPRNHEIGSPFAQYRSRAKTVVLYSLPTSWEFDAYYTTLAKEVDRAGASVTREGKKMRVTWPDEDCLRLWYFFDVFGHELGHHFDHQFRHKNRKSPNRRVAERFADWTSVKLRMHVAEIMKERRANQSPEPTTAAGTSPAEQARVPAAVVAHL